MLRTFSLQVVFNDAAKKHQKKKNKGIANFRKKLHEPENCTKIMFLRIHCS